MPAIQKAGLVLLGDVRPIVETCDSVFTYNFLLYLQPSKSAAMQTWLMGVLETLNYVVVSVITLHGDYRNTS